MQLSGMKAANGANSLQLSRVQRQQSSVQVQNLQAMISDRVELTSNINSIAIENVARSTRMKSSFTEKMNGNSFDVRV